VTQKNLSFRTPIEVFHETCTRVVLAVLIAQVSLRAAIYSMILRVHAGFFQRLEKQYDLEELLGQKWICAAEIQLLGGFRGTRFLG